MFIITIHHENPDAVNETKEKLSGAFPDKNADEMFLILKLYDEAYLSSREYFAYYFPMTTKTVVDYINKNHLGYIWQLITDTIFNDGINSLYSMIDTRSGFYRDVLRRSEKIFGFPISSYDSNNRYIKEIRIYRNQRTAHFGDDYFKQSSSIKYDTPIIMLEHLRRDRDVFNGKYLGLTDTSYDELKFYFIKKIPMVIRMLNATLDPKQIERELVEYLDSVLKCADFDAA